MSLRYTLEETRVLFADEDDRDLSDIEILPSTARPWRKWIAIAAAVALTSGAAVAAYMGVGPLQQRILGTAVNLEASAQVTSIPFGAIDLDADGSISQDEITAMVRQHASRFSDEINNDDSLNDKVRAIKSELLASELEAKVACWTTKFDSFEQSAGPVTEASLPLYLQVVDSECPKLSMEGQDDGVSKTLIVGTVASLPENEEIDAFFSSQPDQDPVVSFLLVDSNMDGEIDENEAVAYLIGHLQELMKNIEADESLDSELKATHLQLLNEEIIRQKDCVHQAIEKLAQDGVKLSPASFQVFELALNDICPVRGTADGAN